MTITTALFSTVHLLSMASQIRRVIGKRSRLTDLTDLNPGFSLIRILAVFYPKNLLQDPQN